MAFERVNEQEQDDEDCCCTSHEDSERHSRTRARARNPLRSIWVMVIAPLPAETRSSYFLYVGNSRSDCRRSLPIGLPSPSLSTLATAGRTLHYSSCIASDRFQPCRRNTSLHNCSLYITSTSSRLSWHISRALLRFSTLRHFSQSRFPPHKLSRMKKKAKLMQERLFYFWMINCFPAKIYSVRKSYNFYLHKNIHIFVLAFWYICIFLYFLGIVLQL